MAAPPAKPADDAYTVSGPLHGNTDPNPVHSGKKFDDSTEFDIKRPIRFIEVKATADKLNRVQLGYAGPGTQPRGHGRDYAEIQQQFMLDVASGEYINRVSGHSIDTMHGGVWSIQFHTSKKRSSRAFGKAPKAGSAAFSEWFPGRVLLHISGLELPSVCTNGLPDTLTGIRFHWVKEDEYAAICKAHAAKVAAGSKDSVEGKEEKKE